MTGRPWDVAKVGEVERLAYELIEADRGLERAQQWWNHNEDGQSWDEKLSTFEPCVWDDVLAEARWTVAQWRRVDTDWSWR
jgi:hypothetical protein